MYSIQFSIYIERERTVENMEWQNRFLDELLVRSSFRYLNPDRLNWPIRQPWINVLFSAVFSLSVMLFIIYFNVCVENIQQEERVDPQHG